MLAVSRSVPVSARQWNAGPNRHRRGGASIARSHVDRGRLTRNLIFVSALQSSVPGPPCASSVPGPPRRRSSPALPTSRSSPSMPRRVSSKPSPRSTSLPSDPLTHSRLSSVSFPDPEATPESRSTSTGPADRLIRDAVKSHVADDSIIAAHRCQPVVTGAAEQAIHAPASDQDVVALPAHEAVFAAAAAHDVVTVSAVEHVVAGQAQDHVVAGRPCDGVVARRSDLGRDEIPAGPQVVGVGPAIRREHVGSPHRQIASSPRPVTQVPGVPPVTVRAGPAGIVDPGVDPRATGCGVSDHQCRVVEGHGIAKVLGRAFQDLDPAPG